MSEILQKIFLETKCKIVFCSLNIDVIKWPLMDEIKINNLDGYCKLLYIHGYIIQQFDDAGGIN